MSIRLAIRFRSGLAASIVALLMTPLARAVDPGIDNGSLLQTYEPITAGYTKDSDDVPYLDVTLSVKLRMLPEDLIRRNNLYLAFTGRFGFYWGTRYSSAVIGKSYNPKLIWRYTPAEGSATRPSTLGKPGSREATQYFDFAYAHQSNGQTIGTQAQYQQAQAAQQKPQFANEYISRGWDYLEVIWKRSWFEAADYPLATYLDLRYFLDPGLLQGHPEEYNWWEMSAEGKPRRAVDGLTALGEYQLRSCAVCPHWLAEPSVWLRYQTGYDTPFRYSTERLEAGIHVANIPLAVWVQHGYMSDLANYYRNVTSYGIELRIGEF